MRRPDFYTYLNYGKKCECSICGIGILSLEKTDTAIICSHCKKKLEHEKGINECGITIYNGKKVLPRITATEAAKEFEISEKRFRTLVHDGSIPGEKTGGGTFWVDVAELDRLILCGKVQVYKRGKKSNLSEEEKLKRKRESNKKYKSSHKEQANLYVHERKQNDPVFKLKCQARNTVYQSFARTGNVKQKRCESITGISPDGLINYLCQTFESIYGNEWDGTEPVHIDHIVPLSTAETKADVVRLCHYTNLQLLKAEDNLAKSNKLDYQIMKGRCECQL